jgi:hypothetical protein
MIKFLLAFLFIFSCDGNAFEDDNPPPPSSNNLDIYDVWKQNNPLEEDSNGYYHFLYNPTGTSSSDYGIVKYITEIPMTLVNWDSPDEFCILFQIQMICQPIINFSTYSGSDGYGQQLFYIDSNLIGDTLTIYGSINSNIVDSVFVIVEE